MHICYNVFMKTAYINRIYPSAEQAEQLMRDINASRFVWNNALGTAKETKWNYNEASRNLTELKKTETWLGEASATALIQKLMDLKDGFTRFFRKQNKYPHFFIFNCLLILIMKAHDLRI